MERSSGHEEFSLPVVRSAIEPLAVIIAPEEFRFAIVRLKAGEIPASLQDVKTTWQRVFPQYPCEYRFFDEDFGQMYQADESMGSLLKVFAGLAMIIACLGLFGLASYTASSAPGDRRAQVSGGVFPRHRPAFSKQFAKWSCWPTCWPGLAPIF